MSLIGLGPGCADPAPIRACLAEPLGQFQLVGVEPTGAGGCQARYRDPDGATARVEVGPLRPGQFAEAGVPVGFEKHMVFFQTGPESARVGWYSENVAVQMELPASEQPEGPVLRAYLFRYPSRVVDQVQATRQDVELLRLNSRRSPGDASVHLRLARDYRKLGDTVMAAGEYHISVEKDPACHACYLEMGTLYRELRHWDLSIRALRKAANIRPDDPAAWLALGDVAYDVHNRLEALRGYRQALRTGELTEPDQARAAARLKELEAGKFLIEVLPGAQPRPDGGAGSGG